MPRSSLLCCDANVVVHFVTGADGGAAQELWRQWRAERRRVIAPLLLCYEVTNALHRLRRSGQATDAGVAEYLRIALMMPIEYATEHSLHDRAMQMAFRFNRPASYDAHYLALSEREGAEFWTADQRLYNSVHHHLPWVYLLGG
ncbi:MAG TPA: type II toxin-antitoxin system VapC family toxin [Thermomicrobiales bacterium]